MRSRASATGMATIGQVASLLKQLSQPATGERPTGMRALAAKPVNCDPDELLKRVPIAHRPLYEQLTALTDAFCSAHLNEEYRRMSRCLAARVCGRNSPITGGLAAGWAAAVVAAVGYVNFLGDRSFEPSMTQAELAKGFGVAPATLARQLKTIRELLKLTELDPRWTLPSLLASNPHVWVVEVDGWPVDMRSAPRELQAEAYELGLIPWIPADEPEV